MKWKLIRPLLFLVLPFTVLVGCADAENIGPLENNATPPAQVEDISVENLPGKARVSYKLPTDQDLLYVKAEYTLENGQHMEVKTSYYNSSLLLEGFAGGIEKEVQISTVNRSEVASEPVTVTVNPLPAPIFDVFQSMEVGPTFGGIFVDAENLTREDIAILIMEKNDQDDWVINAQSIYTGTDDILASIRGMDTTAKDFAVTVRDRWLNYTDTLFTTISPWYEAPIPKSGYSGIILPGDAAQHNSTPLAGLWDGEIMNWSRVFLTQATDQSRNHTFTFDIGMEAKLSRIVIWDYPEYLNGRTYYYQGAPKRFRIWGTDNLVGDGDFANWTLLGTYEETKPSGLPYGQQNNEDYELAVAGFSWDFPIDAPPMRYLRFEMLENWGGTKNIALGELQVYGRPEVD